MLGGSVFSVAILAGVTNKRNREEIKGTGAKAGIG
jgi:hypothetical protein